MKHTYEKPVITVDAGMAEGVYAASGAGSDSSNGSTYQLTQTNLDKNPYYPHAQYSITFLGLPASGSENTATVTLKVTNITAANAYSGGSVALNGTTLQVNLHGWTNTVDFDITYSSLDFTIE